MYYPVSDEALKELLCLFERYVFPPKTIIIHAGRLDIMVYFIVKFRTDNAIPLLSVNPVSEYPSMILSMISCPKRK